MSDLILYHGGRTTPVCREIAADEVSARREAAASLVKVPVSAADLSTVYRWGDGALTPLSGPMDSETFNRVLDEAVIEYEGKKYAWTIPLSLPVTEEQAKTLKVGQEVALVAESGEEIEILVDPHAGARFHGSLLARLRQIHLKSRGKHECGSDHKEDEQQEYHIGHRCHIEHRHHIMLSS